MEAGSPRIPNDDGGWDHLAGWYSASKVDAESDGEGAWLPNFGSSGVRYKICLVLFCTYCLSDKPDSQRSGEHVVGAALGGSWTVWDICKTCQEDIGEAVDRPFARMLWIKEQRHRHQIPDRYGHVPEAPQVYGTVEDGRGACLTLVREGQWQLRILPEIQETDDGSLNLRVSADDEVEYLEKKLARLSKGTPGFRYEISDRTVTAAEEEIFSFNFAIHQRLWPRFAVKVALNVGRELYGRDWLQSERGRRLHEILWDRDTATAMRPLATRKVAWEQSSWSAVPDHVLMALNAPYGAMLSITLFGEDTYGVALGDQPLPEEAVWLLHTREERCERISTDDFWRRVIAARGSVPIK